MPTETLTAKTGYASAYQAHYSDEDVLEALRLYASLIMSHPDTREARDARVQIRNITSQLASVSDVVEADLSLALAQITAKVPPWFNELVDSSRRVAPQEGESP